MAGIGFELRRLLGRGTYTSTARGYLYATIISAGPWLFSVTALALLGLLATAFLGFDERQTFTSTVVYLYAGSLVVTGMSQMAITRYLADALYRGDREVLARTLPPVYLATAGLCAAVAFAVLAGAPLPPPYKVSAGCGFVILGLIWQVMVFLSAAKDYHGIVLAFFVGCAVSFAGGYVWGQAHGLVGYMAGFVLGQAVILALLTLAAAREYGLADRWDWGFVRHARRYPALVGIGFFYNLSIWVDKVLFGLSPNGRVTAERFPTYNHYDSSMFLAYVTVVPAMAFFLTRTETEFAETYKRFYDDIFFRRPLDRIQASKRRMVAALTRSFADLLKVQGTITFLAVYFADDILRAVHLPYSQTGMFRYGLIGSLMQALCLFMQVILLYFDLRGTALFVTVVALVANTAGAAISLELGFPYYGSGFAAAGYVTLLVAVGALYARVRDLEYITFARRRIVGQVSGGRRLLARPGGLYGRYRPVPGGGRDGSA